MLKHAALSALLKTGLSIGQQSDPAAVKALVRRLHPVFTGHDMVRLGERDDGGYVLPNDLDGFTGCFSPGVSNRATFELDLIKRGIPCFLADYSVDAAPLSAGQAHFTKKFIGVCNDEKTMTLDDWVCEHLPGEDDLILQMDIEGSEWPVLLNVSEKTLRRFRLIVAEFHNVDRLTDKHAFRIIHAVFDRLLQYFVVAHNHPNNYGGVIRWQSLPIPRAIELTFLRKDRTVPLGYAQQFPHPLDVPNSPRIPDLVLPKAWYGGH
jgi:hypothetical protein